MSSQCFIMNVDSGTPGDAKPVVNDKLMSYEEKSVGSTAFFKCEACPYMALAEDDIKFHLFTVHPELAARNGLADNIRIHCPGCVGVFAAEDTLRNHLRNHHKMGIKDVKKMVRSLIQLALKNAKLKRNYNNPDIKIPQVIEIVPDTANVNNEPLPTGVTFISVDELHKMSTPNFEKVDPKEIIQEASINIVYTNEASPCYVNVSNTVTPVTTCNVLQVSSVTPDLISSIQPRESMDTSNVVLAQTMDNKEPVQNRPGRPLGSRTSTYKPQSTLRAELENFIVQEEPADRNELCLVGNCRVHLKDPEKLAYHRKCHQSGKFQCPECVMVCVEIDALHTHLWKSHKVDLELPTCEICGYKTYKKHRLFNIHMKCHGEVKAYPCSQCPKSFKNANQLSKHRLVHKGDAASVQCNICQGRFSNERRLKIHIATVHEKLRPFKCCHCDYSAARKEEMKLHLRSHTGDKPYSCDQCSYRSSDHNSMRRHKKIHTKETPYKCKYCPYSTIQATWFASHMISKHPNVNASDVHLCPYCSYKSVNKDNYVLHLKKHTDKEGVQLLIEMTKNKTNKPSWTIPSETTEKADHAAVETSSEHEDICPKTVNDIPIEVFDCDSLSESLAQNFSKNYCTESSDDKQQTDFNAQVADFSKDESNSDCLISESSSDTMRHQFAPQHALQSLPYEGAPAGLHGYLGAPEPLGLDQGLRPSGDVSLVSTHSAMGGSITNSIMGNFPIRLPAQLPMRNNITLSPMHKISLPMTKVTGPIITPTQILPVPSSSNSPVNISNELDGIPRKKPKISVKSNLILKGPDQENMFHSQQKMAFKRLEDNERFGLGAVTFNNLITTQFMQLQPEPALSEAPGELLPFAPPLHAPAPPPAADDAQLFAFDGQMSVNAITLLPPPQKMVAPASDPSYIKIEATIKQNTQSPSLERMCNANIMNNQSLSREYKASPPLEDIHKNINEIKNEVKSDTFYGLAVGGARASPSALDQYLMDSILGEQYAHAEPAPARADVIEIDDNSDDNKLLSRYDINFPLESLYLMHNDFHFLENEVPATNSPIEVNDTRVVTEVPIINQKEIMAAPESASNDYPHFIQGKKDPMMNTSVRQSVNKINVKNIELMKN